MADWSELERLPPDVLRVRAAGAVFAVRADLAQALAAAGYSAESDAGVAPSDLAGRQPLSEIVAAGERFVVRRFTHGGLLRWLTGRRYLDPLRPFRELALSRALLDLGVLVPEVVAAKARRTIPGAWELELVSRRIEDAVDLGTVLVRASKAELGSGSVRRAARAFGSLVRRLHDLEFLHADLTPRNVLVRAASLERGEPELWVLDLDGSRFVPGLGAGQRTENLARLLRHVERMRGEGLVAEPLRAYAAFLAGYEPRRAARRALARDVRAEFARSRAWHAAADSLERGAGGRRSRPRD